MSKLIAGLIKLSFGFIILLALVIFAIAYFIDPNDFKEEISNYSSSHFNRNLEIEGPISISYLPIPSLIINDATLSTDNLSKSKFLKIKKAKLALDLIPLFKRKLSFKSFDLIGVDIFNKDFSIEKLNLKGTDVEYIDGQFNADIRSNFNVLMPKSQSIAVNLNTLFSINKNNKEMALSNLKVSYNNVIIKSNINAKRIEKSAILNADFKSIVNKGNLEGNINFDFTKSQIINFNVKGNKLNLNELQDSLLIFTNTNVNSSKRSTLSSSSQLENNKINNRNKSYNFNGIFTGTDIKYNNISVEEINAKIISQNGNFILKPFNAKIRDGLHVMEVESDISNTIKTVNFSNSAKDFEISNLLSAFNYPKKISGNSNLNIQLSLKGKNQNEYTKYANGASSIAINNGYIYGVDIEQSLSQAKELLTEIYSAFKNAKSSNFGDFFTSSPNLKIKPQSPDSKSPFNKLSATFIIKNGVISTSNFLITYPTYTIEAKGDISLNTKKINYDVSAYYLKSSPNDSESIINFMKKVPLPIRVTGTIDKPVIKPNYEEFGNKAVKELQESTIKRLTNKAIKKVIKPLDSSEEGPAKIIDKLFKY